MPNIHTPAATGILLAGGRSRRMGHDKASMILDGQSLLQRAATALSAVVEEIVIVGAPGAVLPAVNAPCPLVHVEDPVEGEGPLVGIARGLEAARAPLAVVVGVDLPFLQPALLRLLLERLSAGIESGVRWVLPIADERAQPLCSAMARDALTILRARIEAGDRAPMAVADVLHATRLAEEDWRAADPDGLSFLDVDTPEDVAAALAWLGRGE
ncbi:MAG: molybdenum cofactor guanylyltransferase [Chloroflexi bacterium]|nr:MAG: molybdenum cofactor guanylyltransferase [Chloroflexota bacterium]